MTCPTELSLAVFADGASTPDESAALDAHLAACPACRARVDALRAEGRLISAALAHDDAPASVPVFHRPASRAALAVGGILFVLGAGVVAAAPALVDFSLPAPLAWLNPFDAEGLVDLALRVAMFLTERGGAIMTAIAETAAAAVVVGLLVWITSSLRGRSRGPLLLTLAVCLSVVLPEPAQALEIRRVENGNVLVPADETIADTLIAMGETIEVDGNVEGDLIAFGRRVVIRGRIGGQVVTAAQTISIDGEIDGSVLAAAQTLDVSATRIGRNLFGFGATIDGSRRMNIEQNAVVFAERATLAGPVGRDVVGFGEQIEVGSTVGGSLTAYANRLTLLAPARITGDLVAHIPEEDNLTVSPGAVIGGERNIDVSPRAEHDSEYTSFGYYVVQVLRFAAAFLVGVILLALVPRLRRASLDTAAEALVAGGVGLVTLVAVPIIALITAVTIIGIPLAVLAVLLWLVGIYLAKIVLAHFLGARLLEAADNPRHYAVALVVGLLLVMIAVNLPFVGGVLNFLLTICGLGLLVLFAWQGFRRTPAEGGV